MSKQYNKAENRKRRQAYLKRKKRTSNDKSKVKAVPAAAAAF